MSYNQDKYKALRNLRVPREVALALAADGSPVGGGGNSPVGQAREDYRIEIGWKSQGTQVLVDTDFSTSSSLWSIEERGDANHNYVQFDLPKLGLWTMSQARLMFHVDSGDLIGKIDDALGWYQVRFQTQDFDYVSWAEYSVGYAVPAPTIPNVTDVFFETVGPTLQLAPNTGFYMDNLGVGDPDVATIFRMTLQPLAFF